MSEEPRMSELWSVAGTWRDEIYYLPRGKQIILSAIRLSDEILLLKLTSGNKKICRFFIYYHVNG